jgi:multicomponent Na+:H+ antiporter subunit G
LLVELFSQLFMVLGGLLSLIGALGIARFPDLYTRIQASTLCSLGVVSIAFGVMIANFPSALSAKALLVIVFTFLTAPVVSHAIGRAGYLWGTKPWSKGVVDEYAAFVNKTRRAAR